MDVRIKRMITDFFFKLYEEENVEITKVSIEWHHTEGGVLIEVHIVELVEVSTH